MNLFPPSFVYFVISASELICGCDVGIGTMQPLIVVEGNITMVLTNLSGDNAVVSEFLVLRSIFYVDRVQV